MKIKKTNKQINKAEVVVTANEVENCVPLKKQSAPERPSEKLLLIRLIMI